MNVNPIAVNLGIAEEPKKSTISLDQLGKVESVVPEERKFVYWDSKIRDLVSYSNKEAFIHTEFLSIPIMPEFLIDDGQSILVQNKQTLGTHRLYRVKALETECDRKRVFNVFKQKNTNDYILREYAKDHKVLNITFDRVYEPMDKDGRYGEEFEMDNIQYGFTLMLFQKNRKQMPENVLLLKIMDFSTKTNRFFKVCQR